MKHFILSILAFTVGCASTIKNCAFPADEYLLLPTGKEVRLHCDPTCPAHEDILAVMDHTRDDMWPYVSHDPWRVWSGYAITFSENEWFLDDGRQVWGATAHNMRGIYIFYEPEYKGLRPGVLDWELRLPLIEKEIPGSTEDEKIQWLTIQTNLK